MHFVKTEDLCPGMRLAKPIYNRLGVLLYERNTELTPQGINSIRKFSLIGIYVLDPAEPLPPLSEEELHFEQFQTMYMFRLRDELGKLVTGKNRISSLNFVKVLSVSLETLTTRLFFHKISEVPVILSINTV